MRRTSRSGNIIVLCLINMLLNFRWSIPAWVILAAHLIFGFPPLWVFWIFLALWALAAILVTLLGKLLFFAASMPVQSGKTSGSNVVHVDADTPTVNPYSATRQTEEAKKAAAHTASDGIDWNAADSAAGETGDLEWHAPGLTFTPTEGRDWNAPDNSAEGRDWNAPDNSAEGQDNGYQKSVF